MITSLIPDNSAEIALAKLLSLTPFVGLIGKTIFVAAPFWVHTFQNLVRTSSARFVDHEIINGPPVSEYTGRSLKDMNFEIVLHSTMCFDPLSSYERLEKATESGEPQLVFIAGKNYGRFTIRNIEGEETHWAFGRPAVMRIMLTIREYISSLPTVAEQKLREDELRRGDTGKGGPDRLPGTGAVPGPPALTPSSGIKIVP